MERKIREQSVLQLGDLSSLKARTDEGSTALSIAQSLKKQEAYLRKLADDQAKL